MSLVLQHRGGFLAREDFRQTRGLPGAFDLLSEVEVVFQEALVEEEDSRQCLGLGHGRG